VSSSEIERAVAILRAGGLVAFPTETVYGLGADASNVAAVRRIFAAKGRPADHPVIVHLGSANQLADWARGIPPAAFRLAERFWPGPLTMILQRAAGVLDVVTGGQDTVGLRVPSHPLAQALLREFGGGVAAPSANRFGHISPTTAQHVRDELGDGVDLILDGGPCQVGIESTILDLSSDEPVLLRPGHVPAAHIEALLGCRVRRPSAASPRASGTLAAHYAPFTPLVLVPSENFGEVVKSQATGGMVAVLSWHPRPIGTVAALWRVAPSTSEAYARELYASLRELDESGCAQIIVESPPDRPDWAAVQDRLARAAAGSRTSEPRDDVP
jgi:L-threonylcarbamoyladenylate synthase